ncbi:hypothetical protein BH20ACT21_BH20ACT21_13750 [soil metagenome]
MDFSVLDDCNIDEITDGIEQLHGLENAARRHYPIVMAGGIIASIPVLILFLLAQRYVVEGVARSGLK